MAWFFSDKQPEDYEQVLSTLAASIDTKKSRLADIRLRERRATLLFTIYSFVAWVTYLAMWYLEAVPNPMRGNEQVGKVVRTLPIGLVPIIIFFTRWLVQTYYTWRATSEEKALKILLAEQKTKIAEIKKKTNFDSTRNLLEKYGDDPGRRPEPQATPIRQRLPAQQPQAGTPIPQTASKQPPQLQGPIPPYMRPAGSRLPPPQTRKWYDTLADALLGPDEQAASREKYALICVKCFNHNGLVSPEEWDTIQYKCPKCGHFNPSRRAQRAETPLTPATPMSAILQPHPNRGPVDSPIPRPLATEIKPSEPSANDQSMTESAGDVSMMDMDWTDARTAGSGND